MICLYGEKISAGTVREGKEAKRKEFLPMKNQNRFGIARRGKWSGKQESNLDLTLEMIPLLP